MAYFTNIHGKYIKDPKLWEQIAYVKNKIGFSDIVGLEADFENGIFKRIANAEGKTAGQDFDTFPMYGGRRLCNLADDGTVNAWYGEQGYTEDGSNGQVMVWQPRFYYKMIPLKLQEIVHQLGETTTAIANNNTTNPITIDGEEVTAVTDDVATYNSSNFRWDGSKWTTVGADACGYHILKARYYISAVRKNGFKLHPAFYDETGKPVQGIFLSTYEGSIYDVSESKYLKWDEREITYDAGGTPTITNAYPANFTADKLSSIAGVKPASGKYNNLTRSNIEKLATNRGAGWHGENIRTASMEQLLMIIEYAGFDLQTLITQGVINVTDSPDTENNSNYTGSTASIGEGTGRATSSVNERAGYEYTLTAANQTSFKYRGRENIYGNMWISINGVNIWGNAKMYGGMPYICTDYNFVSDKKNDNYESAGFTSSQAQNYIKYFGYGNNKYDWLFMPSKTVATAQSYVKDCYYLTSNLNAYRVCFLGGHWTRRAAAGGFCWSSRDASSCRYRNVGGRSIYIPQSV